MTRFRALPASIAACLGLHVGLHAATASAIDLPSFMSRADTATQADVFVVPPMSVFRTPLDEAHMQGQGCHFVTSDPAAIRALAAMLQRASIEQSPVYQRPDIREAVYLTLADRTQLKFLLQDNNGGRLRVAGVAETTAGGDVRTVAVTAGETLAGDLRGWADARGGVGSGAACDRLKPPALDRLPSVPVPR